MRPILLTWRRVTVSSYPALLYLGLVVGLVAQNWVANQSGLPSGRIYVATLLLLVPALAGARLLFVARHWPIYRREPRRIWRRSEGGGALYGGVPLSLVASVPLLRCAGPRRNRRGRDRAARGAAVADRPRARRQAAPAASPSRPPRQPSPDPVRRAGTGRGLPAAGVSATLPAAGPRLPGPLKRPAAVRYPPPTSRTGPWATPASPGAAESCFWTAQVPGLPFGGFKNSGIGSEGGSDGLLGYTQEKRVHFVAAPKMGLG